MGKKKQSKLAESNERSEVVVLPTPKVPEEHRVYVAEAGGWFIRTGNDERFEAGPPPKNPGEVDDEPAPAKPEHTPEAASPQIEAAPEATIAPVPREVRRRGVRKFTVPKASPQEAVEIGIIRQYQMEIRILEGKLKRKTWERSEVFNDLLKARTFTLDQLSEMFNIPRSTLYKMVKDFRDNPHNFS